MTPCGYGADGGGFFDAGHDPQRAAAVDAGAQQVRQKRRGQLAASPGLRLTKKWVSTIVRNQKKAMT